MTLIRLLKIDVYPFPVPEELHISQAQQVFTKHVLAEAYKHLATKNCTNSNAFPLVLVVYLLYFRNLLNKQLVGNISGVYVLLS